MNWLKSLWNSPLSQLALGLAAVNFGLGLILSITSEFWLGRLLAFFMAGWFLSAAWQHRFLDPMLYDLSKANERQLIHLLLELTLQYDNKTKGRFHSAPDLVKTDPEFNALCKRINAVIDEMTHRKIDNPLSNTFRRLPTV